MKAFIRAGRAVLVMLTAYAAAVPTAIAAPAESAVLAEINRARADPRGYAEGLRAYRALYDGKVVEEPGRPGLLTKEGRGAVDEAIRFLRRQRPLPALRIDRRLTAASADHVRDQGAEGLVGHRGRDGSDASVRVARHGGVFRATGENISYGPDSATAVVREMIVDDGVRDRGHRRNIFAPFFARGGVACGAHRRFVTMCVMTFASEATVPQR